MNFTTLIIIAFGLSMDAFAVSVCKGLLLTHFSLKKAMVIGLWFGCFQAIMPTIGYLFGSRYQDTISHIDHWVAFILLNIIGGNMIKEAIVDKEGSTNPSLAISEMFVLALATSIDALAVGVSLAFLSVPMGSSSILIGTITFLLSVIGVRMGYRFGSQYKTKAELIGGVILMLMAIKILCEHLGIFC